MSIVGEYKIENAVVWSVEKNGLKLIHESSCSVSSGCTNCNRCSNTDKRNIIFYEFEDSFDLSAGDIVSLRFFKFNPVTAAIIMFLIPLIFVVTMQVIFAFNNVDPESGASIVLTLFAFAFGFVIAFAIESFVKKNHKSSIQRV